MARTTAAMLKKSVSLLCRDSLPVLKLFFNENPTRHLFVYKI